jgi:nucleotide-binding universal stress UspA family protein
VGEIRKILVAYDGSADSKTSLDYAIMLAKVLGASLDIVKVFEAFAGDLMWAGGQNITILLEKLATKKEDDRSLLEAACEQCRGLGIAVQATLLAGPVAASLLDYAQKSNIDIIVAGNKGHGIFRQIITGSTTSSLVELSPVPVLVVKERSTVGGLKKLLLAYDGSIPSRNALGQALAFCKATGAELLAVTIADPSSLAMIYTLSGAESAESFAGKIAAWVEEEKELLAEINEFCGASGVKVTTEGLQGNTVDTIIQYGNKNNVDMYVAGSKGRSAIQAMLLGSVARGLVHLSPVPVLVVK